VAALTAQALSARRRGGSRLRDSIDGKKIAVSALKRAQDGTADMIFYEAPHKLRVTLRDMSRRSATGACRSCRESDEA
jgi:hypothetical protein